MNLKRLTMGLFALCFSSLFVMTGCTSSAGLTGSATVEPEEEPAAFCSQEAPCDAMSDDSVLKIPVSDVTSDMQKHTYDANGIEVTYFTVLGSDGEVRTAFDACDVCGGYKGYRQNGADVVCNNCGRYFSIDDIGTKNGPGGCWPSYLSHEIVEGNIIIEKSELASGAFRFA